MSDTLSDFHKHASFRAGMHNYLNTTFTFGKQTKDNFINRKFQCRPTYSFTHFGARFSFGESHGGSSPRRTRNTSWSTACNFRWDQAMSEIQSRYLGRFPVGVDCIARRT